MPTDHARRFQHCGFGLSTRDAMHLFGVELEMRSIRVGKLQLGLVR